MLVVFRCPCGKKLQVKQEFIGKRCACPQCGAKSVVPERSSEPNAALPATVDESVAPPPVTDVRTLPPRKRPVAESTDTTDSPRRSSGRADKPRRSSRRDDTPERSSRATMLLIVSALVGVLLLVGGGFATWFFFFRSSPQTTTQQASSSSDQKTTPVPVEDDLQRVPDDAIGFVTIGVGDWMGTEAAQKLLQQAASLGPFELVTNALGVALSDIRRVTFIVADAKRPCVLVSTRQPVRPEAVRKALVPNGVSVRHESAASYLADNNTALHFFPDNRAFLFGSLEGVHWVATRPAGSGKSSLAAVRPLLDKHFIVAALNLDLAVVREGLASVPEDYRQKYGKLLHSRNAVFTLDITDELRLHVTMTLNNEKEARASVDEARRLIDLGRETLVRLRTEVPPNYREAMEPGFVLLEAMLRSVQLTPTGDTLDADLRVEKDVFAAQVPAILLGVQKVREAASRLSESNNLKQIGLAMHNYHAVWGALPAASISDASGRPLLSWRVALLPFLEQDTLYKQFRLNESWDSPHNKKVAEQMPKVFASPVGVDAPGLTRYRVFTGDQAAFPERSRQPGPTSLGRRLTEFTDGTANTLLVVEAGEAVPWTKPDELPYSPKGPLPRLGSQPTSFQVLFADGSVRVLNRQSVNDNTLRALITPNGGEIVDLKD